MRGKKTAARTPQTSVGKSYLLDDGDRIRVEIPHPKVVPTIDQLKDTAFGFDSRVRRLIQKTLHLPVASGFAGPSEAVPFHGTCRHGPEFDEILRCEVNLVALAQQSGEGFSSNSMLFGIGVGQTQ